MAFIFILKHAAGSCSYDDVWDIINGLFQDDVVDQVFTEVFYTDNTFYKPLHEDVLRDWQVTFKKINPLIVEFIVKSISRIQYAPNKFWLVDVKDFDLDERDFLNRDLAKYEHARQTVIDAEHLLKCPFPIPILVRQFTVWSPDQVYSENKNFHYIQELQRFS